MPHNKRDKFRVISSSYQNAESAFFRDIYRSLVTCDWTTGAILILTLVANPRHRRGTIEDPSTYIYVVG